uniref:IP17031p n=1 Tax=Drosophila melanogaster TaxID=7227 RepID=A1A6T2_DROME|nr:IP17031p [Drosophila melanogaster]
MVGDSSNSVDSLLRSLAAPTTKSERWYRVLGSHNEHITRLGKVLVNRKRIVTSATEKNYRIFRTRDFRGNLLTNQLIFSRPVNAMSCKNTVAITSFCANSDQILLTSENDSKS